MGAWVSSLMFTSFLKSIGLDRLDADGDLPTLSEAEIEAMQREYERARAARRAKHEKRRAAMREQYAAIRAKYNLPPAAAATS
jgi:sRNA-binding protein